MDTEITKKMNNKRIAVITNGWSGEFLSLILEGIRRKAEEDGVDIFVFVSYILWRDAKKRKKEQLKLFDLIHPEDYDGFIVLANTFNIKDEGEAAMELLGKYNKPVITTEVEIPGVPFIGSSNYKGMHELTVHLIEEHNVKSIIYVAGINGNPECAERKKAVTDALKEHGLTLTGKIQGDFGFYGAALKTEEWIEKHDKLPDAFVCANDLMALGVISKLHKHGIEVPRDVIVTGFDHTKESQISYPLVATVSRQWDMMGEYVYDALKAQVADPDPGYHKIFDSSFVPSESCGCPPDEASKALRLEKIRNIYPDNISSDMVDLFFQRVRLEMDKVESKDGFNKSAGETFGINNFFGPDYCFCADPKFFEEDTEEYVRNVTTVGDKIDVLYEKKDGESQPPKTIDTRFIYPGYEKEEGKSNLYIVCLLNDLDYYIGYTVVKNFPEVLYNLQFKRLVNNLDLLLVTIKRYIFAQRNYRKLREIYMTDFLTGLYNRAGCDKILFSFIEEEKAAQRSTTLLFVDINNMKLINDDYGHLNGDLAIKATAEALRNSLSGDWLLARYGGDEFVAVGRHKEGHTIEKYRELFASALKKTMKSLKNPFELSASSGCCVIHPEDTGTIEDYISIADKSMYEEKERAHSMLRARNENQ